MLKLFAKLNTALIALPLVIFYKLGLLITKSDRRSLPFYSQFISQIPGLMGAYIRRAFYCRVLDLCSDDCFIGYGSIFSSASVEIGPGVYIGNYCTIGSVKIGQNTLIASKASLISGTAQHGTNREGVDFKDQPGEFQQIDIGNNCWIGESAVVGADVGRNSIISAGAVVLKDVPENSTAIGNPAKVTKHD